ITFSISTINGSRCLIMASFSGKVILLSSLFLTIPETQFTATYISLVFPRHFKNVTGRVMVNPGFSALTGGIALLASPLVLFIVILLFASVVGIGAGLFVSALYLTGILFSIAYAGTAMGRWILSAARKGKEEPHIIISMLLGVFIALVLCRIPYVGWLFRIGAFIFGFGAFLISIWLEIKPRTERS
ncbi:MAG: hypothetical protein U9Q76_01965, partial [candidate division WOR-3 bacterium]|nr:hypothetical protein [candidate division WOR-3 bacterium]